MEPDGAGSSPFLSHRRLRENLSSFSSSFPGLPCKLHPSEVFPPSPLPTPVGAPAFLPLLLAGSLEMDSWIPQRCADPRLRRGLEPRDLGCADSPGRWERREQGPSEGPEPCVSRSVCLWVCVSQH